MGQPPDDIERCPCEARTPRKKLRHLTGLDPGDLYQLLQTDDRLLTCQRGEEVADDVVIAVSVRAEYLSGIVINVDGGHNARMGAFS
jgi:hypothetical protein